MNLERYEIIFPFDPLFQYPSIPIVYLPVAKKSRLSLVPAAGGTGRNGKFLTQKGDGLLKALQPACRPRSRPRAGQAGGTFYEEISRRCRKRYAKGR